MASTANTAVEAHGPRNSRGRGGRQGEQHGDHRSRDPQTRRGNAGRGNRRGGKGRNEQGQIGQQRSGLQDAEDTVRTKPPPADFDPSGSSGDRPSRAAIATKGENDENGEVDQDDGDGREECFICASEIDHHSVAPCNHRTCHICSLRMRALYKSRLCPHCRSEANMVIFTDDPEKRYEDFTPSDLVRTDENLGIAYEKKEIEDDTILLLRYNCPDETCDVACFSWPDLHRHVRSVHHKQMCDLCTRNKKVFTHEHELYTKEDLRRHEKFGDQKEDMTGFKGHPECGFCRQRFYGDDELYVHCREKHEKCHICERTNPQRQHQYYVNYDSLEQHFRKDHFLCPDQECMDKKFVVFGSEMDLKAHQLEAHPDGLSKDARRDARRVDMAAFDFRQPIDERSERRRGDRSRGRGGGGGGRGRDPNAEPLPPSTAQPMRRDELAYQRQMAIQSAQSVTTRTFGGQLTTGDAYAARPQNRRDAPTTVNVPRTASAPTEFPTVQNLDINTTPSLAAQTTQEQARQMQHNAVVQRASQMLDNDLTKIRTFRERVSAYKTGASTATQMVDTFLALFDVPAVELGKLIKELAELYGNEQRRTDLLKAWNSWRAINEDYPSLPGPNGALPSSNTASVGRRILKLKSSTTQSQRAPATQARTWGNIAVSGAGTGASGFGASQSANRAGAGRVGPAPWVRPKAAAASSTPSSVSKFAAVRSVLPPADAFPSLPAAAKPNTMMAGIHRGTVNWLDRNPPPTNAWRASADGNMDNVNGSNDAGAIDEVDVTPDSSGKKKGRKGKQTTLYHFG